MGLDSPAVWKMIGALLHFVRGPLMLTLTVAAWVQVVPTDCCVTLLILLGVVWLIFRATRDID